MLNMKVYDNTKEFVIKYKEGLCFISNGGSDKYEEVIIKQRSLLYNKSWMKEYNKIVYRVFMIKTLCQPYMELT